MGNEIARKELQLVYGGANIGLMNEVAEGALEEGGEVIGVIPERMVGRMGKSFTQGSYVCSMAIDQE